MSVTCFYLEPFFLYNFADEISENRLHLSIERALCIRFALSLQSKPERHFALYGRKMLNLRFVRSHEGSPDADHISRKA